MNVLIIHLNNATTLSLSLKRLSFGRMVPPSPKQLLTYAKNELNVKKEEEEKRKNSGTSTTLEKDSSLASKYCTDVASRYSPVA